MYSKDINDKAWNKEVCAVKFFYLRPLFFISLEKTPTSISGEYRNKYVSVGVQSPTEIKASSGLQECAGGFKIGGYYLWDLYVRELKVRKIRNMQQK